MLTGKQEAFCLGVVQGLTLTDAYRAAYDCDGSKPETVNSSAGKLAARPTIAARIAAMRGGVVAAVAKKVAYGQKEAMDEAQAALELAVDLGQSSAAVAAIKLRADLSGLLADKTPEKAGALTSLDVEGLLKLQDEIKAKLLREAEALEIAGITPAAPKVVPMRRVIG